MLVWHYKGKQRKTSYHRVTHKAAQYTVIIDYQVSEIHSGSFDHNNNIYIHHPAEIYVTPRKITYRRTMSWLTGYSVDTPLSYHGSRWCESGATNLIKCLVNNGDILGSNK